MAAPKTFIRKSVQLSLTQEDAEDVSSLGDEEVENDRRGFDFNQTSARLGQTHEEDTSWSKVCQSGHARAKLSRDVVVAAFSERGVARQHSAATTGWQATAGR